MKLNYDEGKNLNEIFDVVQQSTEGMCMVSIGNKWNFVNQERKIVSNEWYDKLDSAFDNGIAMVSNNGRINYLKNNGQLVSPNQWFDNGYLFGENRAVVSICDKGYNYLCTDGSILSPDQWFDTCGGFKNGFGKVSIWDDDDDCYKFNFINAEGQILMPNNWVYNATSFEEEGYALIYKVEQQGWNFIDGNGNILNPSIWFTNPSNFVNGFAKVGIYLDDSKTEYMYNFINQNGQIISDIMFDEATSFGEDGLALVKIVGEGWNYINGDGQLLSPNEWFNCIHTFEDKYAVVVRQSGQYNILDIFGNILFENDADDLDIFTKTIYGVVIKIVVNGYTNFYLCDTGQMIFNKWVDESQTTLMDASQGKYRIVLEDGTTMVVDENLKIYEGE